MPQVGDNLSEGQSHRHAESEKQIVPLTDDIGSASVEDEHHSTSCGQRNDEVREILVHGRCWLGGLSDGDTAREGPGWIEGVMLKFEESWEPEGLVGVAIRALFCPSLAVGLIGFVHERRKTVFQIRDQRECALAGGVVVNEGLCRTP
jgi:hypothetical protein